MRTFFSYAWRVVLLICLLTVVWSMLPAQEVSGNKPVTPCQIYDQHLRTLIYSVETSPIIQSAPITSQQLSELDNTHGLLNKLVAEEPASEELCVSLDSQLSSLNILDQLHMIDSSIAADGGKSEVDMWQLQKVLGSRP